ncbi:MAG: hypothetical protein M1542_07545 [Thermotogae bacterium]|jgi:hypothetical protein|nr:hypothetical protein [Thermotogota bacterium]MCL5033078.1 hypothetical protein [Thermotogota bacterium]
MAATVQLDVTYGAAPGTVEANVSDLNMGNADVYPLNAVNNPVAPNANSYERYARIHVVDLGGSTKIQNIRVYRSGAALPSGISIKYGQSTAYATPVNTTSAKATVDLPSTLPSENLFIGGASGGSLSATGYSDYAVFQAQLDNTATAGGSTTISFVYSEVA